MDAAIWAAVDQVRMLCVIAARVAAGLQPASPDRPRYAPASSATEPTRATSIVSSNSSDPRTGTPLPSKLATTCRRRATPLTTP